eukprot:354084-Chlamydomonas_euryale.AAC.5
MHAASLRRSSTRSLHIRARHKVQYHAANRPPARGHSHPSPPLRSFGCVCAARVTLRKGSGKRERERAGREGAAGTLGVRHQPVSP